MKQNRFAKFKRRFPGERNKLEAEYEAHLELLKRAGEIMDYEFEGVKLKLSNNTHLTIDFLVFTSDGFVQLHDTKGTTTKTTTKGKVKAPWIEGDAAIKMKWCAEKYPFEIFAAFKTKDGWEKKQY